MIVKEESLDAYCTRVEQATKEYLAFKKEVQKEAKDQKIILNLGWKKFYDMHIDKAIEISNKHNIKETSLSKICRI